MSEKQKSATCQKCGSDKEVSAYVSENDEQADLCNSCAEEVGVG